ncbi:winged helix-turn-helix transcriptional regulator [Mycobacterium sp. NPDC003449]
MTRITFSDGIPSVRQEAVLADHICPISPVVEVLFSKWTAAILWTLTESGQQRFGELETLIPAITPKVLTQRLRQLERDGLVTRTFYPGIPPRVEYAISPLGLSLTTVFGQLVKWGDDNLWRVNEARESYDRAQAQPESRGQRQR